MKFVLFCTDLSLAQTLVEVGLAHEEDHKLTVVIQQDEVASEFPDHARLKFLNRDLTDAVELNQVLAGQHVAVVDFNLTLGHREPNYYVKVLDRLVFLAKKHKVRRFIMLSNLWTESAANKLGLYHKFRSFNRRIMDRRVWQEKDKQEKLLMSSDYVFWTIIRHPLLTDGDLTKKYIYDTKGRPKPWHGVSKQDLAHCVFKIASWEEHFREEIFVFNPKSFMW